MKKVDDQYLDVYRSGLRAMLEFAKAPLSSAEHLYARELKVIQEALSETSEVSKKIDSAKSLDELREIQMRISRIQVEKGMSCWSGLCEAVSLSYVDALKEMQNRMSQIGDGIRGAASAAPAGAEPVVAALASMVNAACSVCALTAKATEEAARMASAQAGNASAVIRSWNTGSGSRAA